MGRPLVTACVFCLLCCAHVHCSAHNANSSGASKKPLWIDHKEEFILKVFQQYGNGETISLEGFERLLKEINLENIITHHYHHHEKAPTPSSLPQQEDNTNATSCVSSESLLLGAGELTQAAYRDICPVLLSQLMPITFRPPTAPCHHHPPAHHAHAHLPASEDIVAVWLYSGLSILVISLCGLLAVAIIPCMQQIYYHQLLQFLVALAVGTLCGDALLHLLPHAMTSSHHDSSGSHSESDSHHDHDTNIWRGLVAMLGVVFFYFTEKLLTIVAEFRKKRQRKTQLMPKVRVMRDRDKESPSPTSGIKVGEKLCKHKYSSYPYCYGEIADNPDNHQKNGSCDSTEANAVCKSYTPSIKQEEEGPILDKNCKNGNDLTKEAETGTQTALLGPGDSQPPDERYTVIIREHETTHHGHSHSHGHVHAAPQSLSSVAWMVVMGDGLHNFTDGMAIGAAFSVNLAGGFSTALAVFCHELPHELESYFFIQINVYIIAFSVNLAGGFSTALAVFCHELPHELGDFAVLLKAGMSAKQAVCYNMLSSLLCLVGMCVGIALGHDQSMTQWVFAAAAGMFLYIALVDMIPELTSSHSNEGGSLFQCLLHFSGLMAGILIMLLIAVYEHDLQTLFDK